MKQLYISSSIYLKYNGSNKDNKESEDNIVRGLISYVDDIYLDKSLDEKFASKNAKVKIHSAPELIKKMKNLENIDCGLSHSIAILNDIDDNQANEISKKYGIICISAKNDDVDLSVLEKGKTVYIKQDNCDKLSWNILLNDFNSIPCSAIIISDHYFYTEQENASKNLTDLLENVCMGNSIDIMIICGDYSNGPDKNNKKPEEIFNEQKSLYKENIIGLSKDRKETTFNLEFVFIQKSNNIEENIYGITHNRRVFTPYFVINAEHSIAAFGGKAKMQLVGIHALLNDKSLANDKTTDYLYYKLIDYELNLLANRIVEIINEKSARYSCCSIIKGEEPINEKTASIPDVKNSLLADRMLLREGGKCYKVEVDYDYNQDLTTVLIKNDVYESNRLKDTFVRAKRIEVIRVLKEIAKEKRIKWEPIEVDVSHNHYKEIKKLRGYYIYSDYKSIIINELKPLVSR